MHTESPALQRTSVLWRVAGGMAVLLLGKVFLSILWEYRYYFPPNFELSAFLGGRQHTFVGFYQVAFYTHILTGPLALLLSSFLMATGGRPRYRRAHRWAGRALMVLVLPVVLGGLVMARHAIAGPIAGAGFVGLSLATGVTACVSLWFARTRNFRRHRRWAARCFVLLASPLLLRIISGFAIVMNRESDVLYRANAWLSWLLPLVVCEIWLRRQESDRMRSSSP